MNFQASQHSNSADSSTALQQGYLQAYQDGEVVKVFAVLSPKSLQLYSEDPSKYPTASLSASIDLSKSKLLEEGNFKRPKSFGVFGEHSFFEFSCATNSSRLSWVKSFQSAKESSESVSKLRGLKATVDFYRAPSAAPARPQPESQPVPPSVPDSRKFTQSSSTQLFGDALGQLRALNSSVSFQQPPHQSQAMQGQASLVAQPKMKKNLIAKPASSSKSSNSASQSKEPPRWIPGNYKTGGQAPPPRNLSPQKPTRTAVAHRDPPQPSLRASSAPNGRTTARQQQQQQQQHQQQHHHQSQSSMYPQEVSSFATPLSLGGHFPGNQPLSVHSLQTPFDHYPGQGYFPSPFSHGPSGGAAPVYRQHPNAHDHGYGQPPMHMPDNRPSYAPPPTTNYPANSAAAAPTATASNVPSSMEHLTLAQIRAALMSIPVPIRSALIEDASREEKPSLSMDRKKPLTASRGGSGGGNGAGGGYKPDKAMPSAGRDRAVTSERYDARYQQMRPSQHRTPEDERGPEDDDSSIDSGYQRHGHSHSHSHKKPSKAAAYEQHQHQYRQPFPEEEMLGATTYSDSHFHVRSRGAMGHHETDDDHGGRDDRGGYNSDDGRGDSDNDNDDGDLDDAENDDVNGYGMANMYANSSGSPEIHQTYDGDLTVSGRSNPMTKSQDRHRRSDLFQRSTSLKEAMPSRIPIMEQSRRPNPLQRSRSAPVQRPSTTTSGGRAAAATAAAAAAAAAVRTPPSQPSAHLSRSLSKPSHTEPRTDEERESMLDWSKRQARDKRIGANYFGNTKKGAQLVTGQAHAVSGGSRSNSNSPQRRPSTSQTAPSLPIEFAQPLNLRKASAGGTIGPGHGAPKSFFDFKKSSKTADVVATQAPQPPSAGDGRRPMPGSGQPLQPAQQQALEMQLLKYQQELRRKRAEGGPPAATARHVNGADRDASATTAAAAAPAASSSSATKQKLLEDYHRKRQALLLQSASTPTHDTTAGPTSRTKPSLLAAAASAAAAAAAAGTATGAAAGAKGNFYRPTPTAATSIANTAAAVITTTTRPRQFSSESYESVLEDEITDKAEWHRFRSWLESIGMEHYMATMRENGVGKLSVLELLTGNDLAQIGISEDDAAVILHKARELTERIKSFSENVDADDWHVTSTSSRLATPTSFARRNGGGPSSSSYLLNRAAPATPQSVPSMACSTSALPELKAKLVQAYQTGDLDRFFRHWEQLPTFPKLPLTEDFQSQDLKALLRSERPALINAKQAMEFHLHLYFFVYAVKTTAAATATATGGVGGGGGGGVKIAVVKAKAALRKYLERIASLQDDATVAGRGGSGGGVSPGKVASSPSGGGFPLPLRIDPTASPLSPAVKTEPNLSMLGELSPANHTLSTAHAATTATTAAAAATSSVDYARQLSATREFATFAGMVFVPNPQHNPAFQSLFREEWSVALLERLEKFLDAILPSAAAATATTTSGGDGDGAAVGTATATATSITMPLQIARAEEGPAAAAAAAVVVAGAATSAGSAVAVVAGDGGLGEILRPAPVRATDVSVSLQSGTASLKMSQAQDFASSQAAVFGGGGATGSTTSNASQKLPLVPASKVVSASSSFVQPPPPPPAPVPATSTAGSAAMLSGGAVDAAAVAVSETVAVPPTLPVAAVAPVATVGAVNVDVDVSPEVQGITAVAADGLLAGGGEAREVCLSPASSISQLTDDTPLNRVTAALNNHGGGGTSGGAYPHHTMNVWLQSQQQGAAMAGHRPQRAKPTLGSPSPGHSPDRTSSAAAAAAAAAARRPPPGVSSATTGAGIPPTTVLMPLNHRNLLSIQQSQQLQQFQEQFGYAPISPGGSRVSGGGGGGGVGASAGRAETGTPLAATATGVHGTAVRASDLLAVGIDQIDLSPLVSPQTQTVKQPLHVDSPYTAVAGTGADPLASATTAMPSPSALPPSPTARHAPGSGSGSGGGGAVGRTTAKAATTSAASGATSTSKSSLQAQVDNYNRLLKMKKLGKDVALPTAAAAMPTTPLASSAPQATPQTTPQATQQATPQATPPSAQWTPPPPQTPPATSTVMSPAAETTGHGGVEAAPTTVADRPVDDAHSSDKNVDEAAAVVAPVAETPSGDAVVAEVADEPLETIDAEDVALAAELTAAADEPVVVAVVLAAEAAVADEAVVVDVPVAAAAAAAPATLAPAVDEPAVDQPADELPEHEADVPAAASLATDEAPSASSSDEAARVESVTDVAAATATATAAVVATTATVGAEAAESPSEPEPADEPPVTAIVGDATATVADTVVDTAAAAAASGDADTAALDDVFPTTAVSSSGVNPHSHEPQQSVSSSATAASSEVSSTSSAQQRVEHLMSPEQQAAKYKVLLRSNQKRKKQQQQKAAQQQSSDA